MFDGAVRSQPQSAGMRPHFAPDCDFEMVCLRTLLCPRSSEGRDELSSDYSQNRGHNASSMSHMSGILLTRPP